MADPVTSTIVENESSVASTAVSFTAQAAGTLLTLIVAADDYRVGSPSGWTLDTNADIGVGEASFHGFYVWRKIADGTETSVTYVIGSASKSSYLLLAHTNIDTTTPLDTTAPKQSVNTGGNNYTTGTSGTTSSGRKYALAFVLAHNSDAAQTGVGTWTNSYVNQATHFPTGANPFYTIEVAGLAFDGGGTTSTDDTFSDYVNSSRSAILLVFNVSGGAPSYSGTASIDLTAGGTKPTFSSSYAAGIVSSGSDFSVESGAASQMAGHSKLPDNTTDKAGTWTFVSGDFNLVSLMTDPTSPTTTFTAP